MSSSSKIKKNDLSKKIAAQIINYIVQNNLPDGAHLSAQAISEYTQVSRTPVRSALLLLAEHGIVRSEENRGFFIQNIEHDRIAEILQKEEAEDEKLYARIARDKVSGKLPQEVKEAELMRLYHADKGLLLSVLQRMAVDGLVSRKSGRGWAFQNVLASPSTIEQSYHFRKIIEPAALLEESFRLEDKWAEQCLKEHEALLSGRSYSITDVFEANANFHEMLAYSSRNEFILEAVRQQNRLRRFVEYSYQWKENPQWVEKTCSEHIALLEAVQASEMRRAANLMWQHLDRGNTAIHRETSGPLTPAQGQTTQNAT